jgi:hypothetical protein
MRNVTFYAATMSQWSVIRPIVERDSDRFRTTFIVSKAVETNAGLNGSLAYDYDSASEKPADDEIFLKVARANSTKASIFNLFARIPPAVAFQQKIKTRAKDHRIRESSYLSLVSSFKKKLSYYGTTLLDLKTDVLVVGEDGISGDIWLISTAKRLGIPVVVLPYEASGKEDFINVLEQRRENDGLIQPSEPQLALLEEAGCSAWAIPFGDRNTTLYPIEYIVALADVGIHLPNPWTTHGGEADYLLAESKGMQQHYLDEGLASEKIRVVGSPYGDRAANQLEVRRELGEAFRTGSKIETGKTRILVSLPPTYHDSRAHLSPYATFEEMIRDVAETVTRDHRVEATFVVHPALSQQQSAPLSIGDFAISPEWVIDLIPQHDIFISCGSSTLRWSVAARKPTINVDYYRFQLRFFDRLEGLSSFEDPKEFSSFIARLIGDDSFYRSITTEQSAVGDKWGILDGENIDRIEDLLTKVETRRSVAQEPKRRLAAASGAP